MAYIRPKAVIQADIVKWELKLTEAETTLDAINATANERNLFDDNEGRQSLVKRKIEDQTNYIDYIEDKLRRLYAELAGRSTRVLHVNRRSVGNRGINFP